MLITSSTEMYFQRKNYCRFKDFCLTIYIYNEQQLQYFIRYIYPFYPWDSASSHHPSLFKSSCSLCVCVGTVLKIINHSFQMVVDQVIPSTHVYNAFHHLKPQKHTAFQILTQLIPDAAFENATLMLHILSRPQLSSTMITISMKMMTEYLRIISFLSDIHWLTNYPMHFYWSETCEPDSGDYTFSKVDMHGHWETYIDHNLTDNYVLLLWDVNSQPWNIWHHHKKLCCQCVNATKMH